MVHISEASSIAIHMLALIAEADSPLNVTELTKLTNFSRNHISKVMQILVKSGYLNSGRGPKGGFMLKMNSTRVTLLEIIELIEGTVEEKHCRKDENGCPFEECLFGGIPEKLTREFRQYFASTRISDVKRKSNKYQEVILKK